MSKCKNCGSTVSHMKYHCTKCRKELAGTKPRKSKDLCSGCRNTFYNDKYRKSNNISGTKGCWSYKGSKVIMTDVYFSPNQVVPKPRWRLSCFIKQH